MDADTLRKRIQGLLDATGKGPVTVSVQIGKGRDYLSNLLNGRKDSIGGDVIAALAMALDCSVEYLADPEVLDPRIPPGTGEVLIRIRGYVGADPDARVQFASGDAPNDLAERPPGASPNSVALYVNGPSMRGIADEGSLIFYEQTSSPPTPEMLSHVVVVETMDGNVLVKRLLRGSKRGLYDLESNSARKLEDVQLKWAAHIQSIVPPYQARRIIRKLAA